MEAGVAVSARALDADHLGQRPLPGPPLGQSGGHAARSATCARVHQRCRRDEQSLRETCRRQSRDCVASFHQRPSGSCGSRPSCRRSSMSRGRPAKRFIVARPLRETTVTLRCGSWCCSRLRHTSTNEGPTRRRSTVTRSSPSALESGLGPSWSALRRHATVVAAQGRDRRSGAKHQETRVQREARGGQRCARSVEI